MPLWKVYVSRPGTSDIARQFPRWQNTRRTPIGSNAVNLERSLLRIISWEVHLTLVWGHSRWTIPRIQYPIEVSRPSTCTCRWEVDQLAPRWTLHNTSWPTLSREAPWRPCGFHDQIFIKSTHCKRQNHWVAGPSTTWVCWWHTST